MTKDIVVSGMRPTGKLHLGNYLGALKNWINLQDKYKCFYFVADYHALTTAYDRTENIVKNSEEMIIDWLTAGLDPAKCTLFVQSNVPAVSELTLLLGMITPLGGLLRNPAYKEQLTEIFKKKFAGQEEKLGLTSKMENLSEAELNELSTYGFLGYPVLMATDILIHNATLVPVGQDQTAHLEIARDIARKFNSFYGADILVEPKPMFTNVPRVPGLDGRKMSKSYGNTIELGEELDSVRKKVMAMFTDPNKKKANDPADPAGCVVFAFHQIYNPNYENRCQECKAGALGCVQCKRELFELMEGELKTFNERRKIYSSDLTAVRQIMTGESLEANASAELTLKKVKEAMRLK